MIMIFVAIASFVIKSNGEYSYWPIKESGGYSCEIRLGKLSMGLVWFEGWETGMVYPIAAHLSGKKCFLREHYW